MDLTQNLLILSVLSLWTSGLSEAADVNQADTLWTNQGETAKFDCSHTKDATYYQMYWYQQLAGRHMKQVLLSVPDSAPTFQPGFSQDKFSAVRPDAHKGSLVVKDVAPGDAGRYFCAVRTGRANEAYFGQGTKLTVLETGREITPPKVKILHSLKSERARRNGQKKKTLVCLASGFYPDHVSVSWNCSAGKCDEIATDSAALLVGEHYRITSRLSVRAEIWENPQNEFTCVVRFFDGKIYQDFPEKIQGVEGNSTINTRENYLRITQTAKLSYCVFIVKSCAYAAFVGFVMWKLQSSQRKR